MTSHTPASSSETITGAQLPRLAVNLAPQHHDGLLLRNPIATAAGTFGYGIEYAKLVSLQRIGAIFCKGTTRWPRRGAPPPRVVETAAGMLNGVGLQNPGIEAIVHEKSPIWERWQVPVIVNIAGETIDEYVDIAETLESIPGISGIELNISCPNHNAGGIIFGSDPQGAAAVTRAVRSVSTLPLIVKLTPNVSDIRAIAAAVEEAGADALTLINTVLGLTIDIHRRRPYLGNSTGGLSGPAIKPIAVRMVFQVAQTVSIPIIGVGGILTATDALEFFMAGAHAVQIGTATFANPTAVTTILDDLIAWLTQEKVQDIHDIIGIALPETRHQ